MPQSPGRDRHHRRTLAIAAVLIPLAVAAGWLITDSFRLAISMPAQINYLDGYIVDDAIRVAAGEALYEDPDVAPYAINMYAPAAMYAMAALIRGGVDGFSAGRLLSLVSVIGIAFIIVLTGWPRTGWVALAVGLLYLLHPVQWPWSLVVRPDEPALLLAIAGIALLTWDDRRWWPAAAVLLAASLLTKQSSIAAPVAAGSWLVVKNWRRGAAFAAVYAGLVGAAVVFLQWRTDGFFLFHVAVANDHPFSWNRVLTMYHRFTLINPLVVGVFLILLGVVVWRRRWSLPAVYALTSAGVAMAVGRLGASLNHFLEPVAAIALLAACEFPVEFFGRNRPIRTAIAVLLAAGFGLTATASFVDQWRAHQVARAMVPVHNRLVETIAAVDGPVVADDAAAVVAAGKRVYIRPFIMSQLAARGRWDQTPFVEEIRQRRIGMIIVRTAPRSIYESRYTPEMRQAIEQNYEVAFSYMLGAPFAVLRPRPDPAPASTVQSDPQGG